MTTLVPAYGRDYKSAKAARDAYKNNVDFIIADFFHVSDGKPINKSQCDAENMSVTLRYNKLTKVCAA